MIKYFQMMLPIMD